MKIVAPVMRHLGVADPGKSAAYYRDVLGFEVGDSGEGVEMTQGPARIVLEAGFERPAVVFFAVDDVKAMHGRVAGGGGQPTRPERANFIKYEMFSVADLDGHTLWFGESYQQPDKERERVFWKGLPELPFDEVAAAVAYYRDVLGFSINYQQGDLGVMDRGEVTVLLIQRTEQHKGIGSAYFYVADADAVYAEWKAKGAKLLGEPVSRPWGLREFEALDLEGNRLRIGQPFE